MSSRRDFPNPFPDYSVDAWRGLFNSQNGQPTEEFQSRIKGAISNLLAHLERAVDNGEAPGLDPRSDSSVYTGVGGICLLYYRLGQVLHDTNFMKKSLKLLEKSLKNLRGKKFSFLCGDAGPLALGAVILTKNGQLEQAQNCIETLKQNVRHVTGDDTPDEMLFGRAGYLHSLLLVNSHLGNNSIDKVFQKQVIDCMLRSGQLGAKGFGSCKLMYAWHGKNYLGAAHGVAGILFTLMRTEQVKADAAVCENLIKPTLEYLLGLRFPSGNFPSSLGSETDKLVHWCHGAPGFIHMWLEAYKLFQDDRYLEAALGCGRVIWERGLLRKGYGICHGVAGNGYAHLALWNVTKDPKHLYRACRFAEWIFDYGSHGCPSADRPYSLFEGMAGTIYFLADLLNPNEAQFPAFY